MTRNVTDTLNKQTWMSNILDIHTLKLTEIVWPGVHNAGMDKKAPNYEVVSGNWVTCQNDTFAFQLSNGARAFDIRLGYKQDRDSSTFYFHHNGYQSERVLDDLIGAVLTFLERNPDEFIVLDFHQLGDGSKAFDFKQFSDLLVSRLGPSVIPPTDARKTVSELKQASSQRRIVMSAQVVDGMNGDYFWPKIVHKWTGTTLTDAGELRTYITTTLRDAPYERYLWSLSATTYTLLGGPQHTKNLINDWFSTTRDWVTRCSIISTDFFDESDIVRYCWVASSMKAVYGSTLHEPRNAQ